MVSFPPPALGHIFFFSSRRRHTRLVSDWSSDVCSSDLTWGLPSAHERLIKRYCDEIRALPEEQASRFVSRLAETDVQWTEVIVAATADDRPLVATAAESEIGRASCREREEVSREAEGAD